jgi:uncharacterized protein
MQVLAAGIAGIVFGIGILLSGMGNPAKVLNFFDIAGAWDPSLAFVMASALVVTAAGYWFVLSSKQPVLAETFHLPTSRAIDARLIAGSAVFGIGWGLSGFCPGGLVPVLAIGRPEPLVFFAGLIGGLLVARFAQSHTTAKARAARPSAPSTQA